MTDRINLTELRAEREEWKATGIPCQECAADADHVLALIDAAEAARELMEADKGDNLTAIIRAAKRLRDALDRFDHT